MILGREGELENPFFKKLSYVHLRHARVANELAQLTLKVKVPSRDPEYHVFQRAFIDKSSFLEWRLAFIFSRNDVATLEALSERIKTI